MLTISEWQGLDREVWFEGDGAKYRPQTVREGDVNPDAKLQADEQEHPMVPPKTRGINQALSILI